MSTPRVVVIPLDTYGRKMLHMVHYNNLAGDVGVSIITLPITNEAGVVLQHAGELCLSSAELQILKAALK